MKEIKEIIALLVLVVCSYTDVKERQIYILPLLIGGIGSLAVSIIMCITGSVENTIKSVFLWLVFPILFGLFLVFFVWLSKGEIGMGDGYLALMLGLCLGVTREVRMLCFAVIFAGLFCFGLILCNKDKLWKNIPFVPFILAGFIVVVAGRL